MQGAASMVDTRYLDGREGVRKLATHVPSFRFFFVAAEKDPIGAAPQTGHTLHVLRVGFGLGSPLFYLRPPLCLFFASLVFFSRGTSQTPPMRWLIILWATLCPPLPGSLEYSPGG